MKRTPVVVLLYGETRKCHRCKKTLLVGAFPSGSQCHKCVRYLAELRAMTPAERAEAGRRDREARLEKLREKTVRPAKHRITAEDDRIESVLRRERQGHRLPTPGVRPKNDWYPYLSTAPLIPIIDRELLKARAIAAGKVGKRVRPGEDDGGEGIRMVAAWMGTSERNVRRWYTGEADSVEWDTAERCLMSLGVEMSEVWDLELAVLDGVAA